MHTDPADQLSSRIALLQQRRKAIAGAVWAVAGLVIVFSLGTGTSLLIDHGVWWGIAWMPSVAADVALIVSLLGDQVLSDSEIGKTPRWGKVLRYVAALVTLGLNTTAAITGPTVDPHAAGAAQAAAQAAQAAGGPDWVSVGIHASIVLVLIAATEAAQAYVRSFAPELVRLRTELADLGAAAAAAVERERVEAAAAIERERAAAAAQRAQERAEQEARHVRQADAQRAAAEAAERASAAARDRASAERDRASAEAELVRQRASAEAAERASAAALARASAEAERVRQEERERRSQARRAAPPTPPRMRQEDVTAAALRHAEQHDELPSESELVTLTGTSRATAGRALRAARHTHEQTQSLRLVQTSP